MSFETAAEYIERRGWKVHTRGERGWLTDCPFCDHKKCFNIHPAEHGAFQCMSCEKTGNLMTLKRHMGDLIDVSPAAAKPWEPEPHERDKEKARSYHHRLMDDADDAAHAAWEYIASRGITRETAERFRLGVSEWNCREHKGGTCEACGGLGVIRWLAIPYLHGSGVLGIKQRSIPPAPKTFTREKDRKPGLFNAASALRAMKDEGSIIICEGELDAISWHQYGRRAVVSLPDGAKSLDPATLHLIEDAAEVFLSLDMDDVGRTATLELSQRIGTYRCRIVELPEGYKDCNACLQDGITADEMGRILDASEGVRNEFIRRIDHYVPALIAKVNNEELSRGMSTGWESLDTLWGGLRMCELSILTGDTGSGKTTFATDFARRQARHHPVLIAEFENEPDDILAAMISQESGVHYLEMSEHEIRRIAGELADRHVYILDHRGAMGLDLLRDTLLYARQRYGVRFFVIDHLHYFLTLDGRNDVAVIRDAGQKISDWAHEWAAHIMLIAHPRQLESDNTKVQMFQIKGGSDLKQIADTVFSIWRRRTVDRDKASIATLTILKCRSRAGNEGSISLDFEKHAERFIVHDDDIYAHVGRSE